MSEPLDSWFASLLERSEAREDALQEAHRQLKSVEGALAKVTVHRYICRARGCPIGIVFLLGGVTLCAVRDYKFSPGLNRELSVASARERKTLDGDRHWPGHVHDISALAQWDTGAMKAGVDMNCRHRRGAVLAADILAITQGVRPGHPDAPTRL